jgi:hypothetical protein
MRSKQGSFRALVSLFVAVVFAVAATPGSMAMPAAGQHGMNAAMAMDCSAATACDHMMKPGSEQGQPCKNMAVCLGMLACFGMAAVDTPAMLPLPAPANDQMAIAHQNVSGLTLRPENPPPIV